LLVCFGFARQRGQFTHYEEHMNTPSSEQLSVIFPALMEGIFCFKHADTNDICLGNEVIKE